jgi:hypothetical protein
LSSFAVIRINKLELFSERISETITAGILYFIACYFKHEQSQYTNELIINKDILNLSVYEIRGKIHEMVHISKTTIQKCSNLIFEHKEKIFPQSLLCKNRK